MEPIKRLRPLERARRLAAGMSFPVFTPDGQARSIYNGILVFVALGGTIITAYRLTFRHLQLDSIYWLITAAYLLDIPYTFNQAIKKGLVVISDRRGIAKAYLKSWFVVDLITAMPFAFFFSLASGGALAVTGATADIVVILKLLKMAKISKVSTIFRDIRESLRVNPAFMRLVTFAFWFVTVVHLMACGWVLIGASDRLLSARDQYIRALYWCVTTIATIGYGDYTPDHGSNLQIIYTVVVMVFGVGMYGYIIGNVATLIANLDVARAGYQKRMEEVNVFLRAKKVPAELQARVRDYYAYLWETRKSISTESVAEELPYSLSMEVLLFLNKTILEKVSLFKRANEVFIREVVQRLRPMVFLPGDYIIRQGEFGDCMYFLSNGDVEVVVNNVRVAQLGQGSPFGETALMKGEKRMASVRALSYCDAYKLSKDDFDDLRARHPDFDAQVRSVVQTYLKDTREKTRAQKVRGNRRRPAPAR